MSRFRPPRRHLGARSVVFVAAAAALSVPAAQAAGAATPAPPVGASASAPSPATPSSSTGKAVPGAKTPLGTVSPGKGLAAQRQGVVPGQVLLTLAPGTSVTGGAVAGTRVDARVPDTDSTALDTKLRAAGATSLHPLLPSLSRTDTDALTRAARSRLGDDAADMSRTYVVQTKEKDSAALATSLQGTAGVAGAEPNRYVNTLNTGGTAIGPAAVTAAARSKAKATPPAVPNTTGAPGVPDNYALTSSAQALLNAGGVNAVGAFATLQGGFRQQPGTGETITNVSVGDLTDQSMADAGDVYVTGNGPTTVLRDGQRYLDLPSMPLIPAYVATAGGGLDGAASTENQDPSLDEVMLDFSVMSPLPHDQQRPDATGDGYTDLLGIAPGADYRLVVPQQPTTDQIAGALLAAAHQSPRPDVITASLGFGTDAQGFPGRYLEDDPYVRSVVASIVQQDKIVVTISSNDGTRLYTPASVGPDGGSTPTDTVKDEASATTIDDDAESTTPSEVPDSGAIAAGGTTLDDTLATPADGGRAVTAETRISGFGTFSSGFGTRVDLSAPSDNVIAFSHAAGQGPQAVDVSTNGGTSASAPEIAAAAADVLQAGRLAGHRLDPAQVRDVLERTGRAVATPPQIDRALHVGPAIDVTAAVEKELGGRTGPSGRPGGQKPVPRPALVRLSVGHRVTAGGLGGSFLETTDQNTIDLGDMASGGNGEGLVGPLTFAGDVTGLTAGQHPRYTLTVGSKVFSSTTPAVRVTPTRLLEAAKLPVVSATDRKVTVTYRVLDGERVLASESRTLTVGPSDGTYVESTAPRAPSVVRDGDAVTVAYDLTGVAGLADPHLVLSTVGHWNPALAPNFTAAWNTSLTAAKGTVTLPASAFTGGGLYGIGIAQAGFGGNPLRVTYGEFAAVRVAGASAGSRPAAPGLGAPVTSHGHPVDTDTDTAPGHTVAITRSTPSFAVHYDVRNVPGATSAEVEFSAPGPTIYGSLNTFTNANGSTLDDDGVDTPSAVHRTLGDRSGTVRFDALGLGLSSSSRYGVRILALDKHGKVVGQASPASTLALDDGLAPDGATVLSFGMAGADSVAALRTAAGGTEVVRYSATSGTYGSVIASDPGTASDYEVIGVAASAHRVLLVHQASEGGDVRVETWNTATGTLVGTTSLAPSEYTFVVGRVDSARDRGALLLRDADNNDVVLPVDLRAGTAGSPVPSDPAGVPAGTYSLLDIDGSTGDVYLAKGAPIALCLGGVVVARVDLTAGTVSGAGTMSGCSHGFGSDGDGTLYNVSATALSTKIVPTSVLTALNTTTGEEGDAMAIRQQVPVAMAVDGRNQVALVQFASPVGTVYPGSQQGLVLDNNATAQMAVVSLKTGAVLATLDGFSALGHGGGLVHGGEMNAVQLDPAHRTGFTYGAYDGQIQQFSY
jgi:hypothetical protein